MTTNKITTVSLIVKKMLSLEQLIELFPQKLQRTSAWGFFDSGDTSTGTFIETLDETIRKMVLPAEEVTVFMNSDDEVTLVTEYRDCEVISTLRRLTEER